MPRADDPFVLYVDDDAANLKVFEANFRPRFNVVTCAEAEAALQVLADRGRDAAVLISDQRMPGMSGVELLERTRELYPEVQRMLITAYSDLQAVIDAVNRGQVSRYFVKPWVREELGAALDEATRVVKLQRRMHAMEALALLGQFTAGVAHELMNPLSWVTQNLEVLRQEVDQVRGYAERALARQPDERVRQAVEELPAILDDMERGTAVLKGVAVSVRSHARTEEAEGTADLADVAAFAVKLARAQVRQRARVTLSGPSVQVTCGPVRLTQILLNLLINAAHALEGLERAGRIEVRWAERGDCVHLSVTDNGAGILPENLQRLFEPLFTTKAPGGGTGLGLFLCRNLARKAGGDITLESKPGEGTTVLVTLPVVRP